jgi:hypothetical protein
VRDFRFSPLFVREHSLSLMAESDEITESLRTKLQTIMQSINRQSRFLENTGFTLRSESDPDEKVRILRDGVAQVAAIQQTLSVFLTEIVLAMQELRALNDPAALKLVDEVLEMYRTVAAAFNKANG